MALRCHLPVRNSEVTSRSSWRQLKASSLFRSSYETNLAKSQDSAKLISYELRKNEDVFMEEGRHDASVLQVACEELPSDKQVVMDSVRQDGYGFGEELRSDSEVVMEGKQHRA